MATPRGTGNPEGVLYGFGELGPWWSRAEAIGLGGRFSGAALCARCRGVVDFVGGRGVWSGRVRFQSGCGRKQAWLGRTCARGG
jgi:hypothetical protein